MSYTANQLITNAYYNAGIIAREFENINATQTADGLFWLNQILAEKRVDDGMIPYETTYGFNAIIGQEKYFIPDLIQIDTLVIFLDNVRYPMKCTKRNEYFGTPRVNNITTLPFEWYFERQVGGGNIYIYFQPDRNYPIEVHGIFGLKSVSLNQDLSLNSTTADLGVPKFYGLGSLNQGQLVVNNVDLFGDYANIGALANYINSGIVPGVRADIVVNDFVLSSVTNPPVPIYISTNGYPPNGTRTVGNASTISITNLSAIYNNGNEGIGATLTALAPGVLTISGYTVLLNDMVLVNGQSNKTQNGLYRVTTLGTVSVAYVLTRSNGYNQSINIENGDLVNITNSIFQGETFIQNSEVTVIGLSQITFTPFNGLTFSNFSTINIPNYEVFNPTGFDQFYTTYLEYALTDVICAKYNFSTPANILRQLSKYESWINKKSRTIDLAMQKVSTLQKRGTYGWAFINLGKGWTPG